MRLDKPTTPTLILHGAEDRCTPLGQAQEFYAALVERGVDGGAGRLSARGPRLPGARPSAGRLAANGRLVRPLSRNGAVSGADLVRFILWRLAVAVPLLLIISFGVFALVHLAPGDPVRALLGTRPVRPGDARGAPRALSPQRPLHRPVRQMALAGAAGRSRPLDQRQPAGPQRDQRARRRHHLSSA